MSKLLLIAYVLTLGVFATAQSSNQKPQTFDIKVTEKGFQPNSLNTKSDSPVILNITRKTNSTCATQIQIPSKNIKKDLPLNKTVSIELGKLDKGEINFGCGMNMMEGGIISTK